jgi:YjbE family integral membrane protein
MEWMLVFLKIMLVNFVLSGDNAVIIAMASRNLPLSERTKAVWWGAAGAIGLRLVLLAAALVLLSVPLLAAAGAVLLFYIAIKLMDDHDPLDTVKSPPTLASAIWTIMTADLIMSLDNVLAIAAIAKGNFLILLLGIAFSIPLIIWGSGVILHLLQKFPLLIYLAAGVIGYAAGEMFVSDRKVLQWIPEHLHSVHWIVPAASALLVIAFGGWKRRSSAIRPVNRT